MTREEQFTIDDALELATYSAPSWNDGGTYVGYQRFYDGETTFVAQSINSIDGTDLSLEAGDERDTGELAGDVSEHDWRPGHATSVAAIQDGDVVLFDAVSGESETLAAATADHSSLVWHPDGESMAYVRDGSLWLHDVERGSVREVAGDIADLFGQTPVEWSTDGRYLTTLTNTEEGAIALTVYEPSRLNDRDDDAHLAWARAPSPEERVVVDTFDWAGEFLVYAEDTIDGIERRYYAVQPDEEHRGTVVLSETNDRRLSAATVVGHESGRAAVVAAPSGYHHVHVLDVANRCNAVTGEDAPGFDGRGVLHVTTGGFEARGDALDSPAWDEDGERLAYVTNEHDLGERQLHVATIGEDGVTDVVAFDGRGNTVYPTWANGRIVCLRSGRTTPADVHVFDIETGAARRISVGHTSVESLEWFPDPEPVSFESTLDEETVYGYLYTPTDATAGDDRSAVVWAHGGPIRQMRRGFHHMQSYAFFHAFNHLLVDRGYVVLALNYRGSIGYGREYEQGIHHAIGQVDVQDCVDAATFLREHDAVGDRVGFWGLSYGGFLANAVATKSDSFDCAVNFAGIWDWRGWVRYATERSWGAGRRFTSLFGDHPDVDDPSVEERYRTGSPCDHVAELDVPLFALHGTDDPNVPFGQMDELVSELVERGDDFEMAYYPDEDHMFQRPATWRDALARVLSFFDEQLGD